MKKVYIILPVHNRRDITKRFMNCLCQQTYKNYQLVLIDDGSEDGTAEMVKSYMPDTVVIKGNGNLWWGGSLHEGYKWICNNKVDDRDIILIINDDTEFDKDFLEKGVRLLGETKKSLILAVSKGKETNRIVSGGVSINWIKLTFKDTLNNNEIDCLPTRGLFLYAGDFKNIGGFYPKLLPHYLSDYEYTIRAKRKGYNLKVMKELHLFVDENQTGYHDVILEKSYLKFLRKYFSKKSPGNPITWTVFVLLAAPLKWKIFSLIRVWGTAFMKIFARRIVILLRYKNFKF